MIERELVHWLSEKLKLGNPALVEKDLILQGLLLALAHDKLFSDDFVFKGGTCLTKAYFGYYRFSEDLDFTRLPTSNPSNAKAAISEKQARKTFSKEVDSLVAVCAKVATECGLDFKPDKSNLRYAQLGQSSKMVTFKLWYVPVDATVETFIKIQLNLDETMAFKPQRRVVRAIATAHRKEIEFLYPKHAAWATQDVEWNAYDLREIASEKIRALLTRRGFKARDLVDLYMLDKAGITVDSVTPLAVQKTKSVLKYEKYAANLTNRRFDDLAVLGSEQNLLMQTPGKDFDTFTRRTLAQLNTIASHLQAQNQTRTTTTRRVDSVT